MNRRQADRLCAAITKRGRSVALSRPEVVERKGYGVLNPDTGLLGLGVEYSVTARDVASGGVYTVPPGVTTWRELRQRLIAESEVRSE